MSNIHNAQTPIEPPKDKGTLSCQQCVIHSLLGSDHLGDNVSLTPWASYTTQQQRSFKLILKNALSRGSVDLPDY